MFNVTFRSGNAVNFLSHRGRADKDNKYLPTTKAHSKESVFHPHGYLKQHTHRNYNTPMQKLYARLSWATCAPPGWVTC